MEMGENLINENTSGANESTDFLNKASNQKELFFYLSDVKRIKFAKSCQPCNTIACIMHTI